MGLTGLETVQLPWAAEAKHAEVPCTFAVTLSATKTSLKVKVASLAIPTSENVVLNASATLDNTEAGGFENSVVVTFPTNCVGRTEKVAVVLKIVDSV